MPGRGGKDELKSFTFEPNTPLEMPQDYALRFLEIDPAFIVRNSKGAIIRPRNQADPKDRVVTVKPHEMVVPLTAVLKQHLFEIAQTLPGGDRYTSVEKVDREELEEFIITGGKVDEDDLIDDEDA